MEESESNDETAKPNGKGWAEINAVLYGVRDSLEHDVKAYWTHVLAEPEDVFWRRGFVRAVFAFFEGLTSTLKGEALALHVFLQRKLTNEPIASSPDLTTAAFLRNVYEHFDKINKGANFEPWEIMLIGEQSYRLTDSGEIKWGKAKLRLDGNLVFSFRMLAKAARVKFVLPKDEAGWSDFKKAVRIRDRLTHPRLMRDIDVSAADIETVLRAFNWIQGQHLSLRTVISEAREREGSLREHG